MAANPNHAGYLTQYEHLSLDEIAALLNDDKPNAPPYEQPARISYNHSLVDS